MKMLDAGEGMTAVARALGVSRQSIYRIKNEVTV
jgi:DNA-binding phage protein